MKITTGKITWTCAGMMLGSLLGVTALADDTELLLAVPGANPSGFSANIMLIVDSSGSMDGIESVNAPYDSALPYSGDCDASKFYWSSVNLPPDCATATSQRIDKTSFDCAQADRQIDGIGLYQGVLVQYRVGGGAAGATSSWNTLDAVDETGTVECHADSGIDGNGSLVYAQAGSDMAAYTDDPTREVPWGSFPTSESYTVYDGNYLNWRENPALVPLKRIDIVKKASQIAMDSINSARIGIMRFDADIGGHVIAAMQDLDSNRAGLATVMNGIVESGNTPLAETLYESALYWLGEEPYYGLNAGNPTDPTALAATSPVRYNAPPSPVCTKNYNVLLTDGVPNEDLEAQTLAPTLPNFEAKLGRTACTGTNQGDCLDDIAEYLSIPDYDTNQAGEQFVTTHTIGFAIDLPILKSAAEASGGEYYLADDVESLTLALLQIFQNASDQALAFTSPAVAVNAFNRTQNLNDLYMTVFTAKAKTHWPGNLKKYRLLNRVISDANDAAAVDPASGFFLDTAVSYWTVGGADGKEVELGGAANLLPDPSVRKLYTNNGSSSDLTDSTNAIETGNTAAFTLADFGLTGAIGEPTMDEIIRWARGEDIRDEDANSNTTVRNVMGDPLHSQPAAVVHGGSAASPEVVVYTATNDGYLHAVDAETGVELWSFIPKELMTDLNRLFFDPDANAKHYGIDGDVFPIVTDANKNGFVDGADVVYLAFGLRRGGDDYYLLDVTDRNTPILKWKVSLTGAGQSWSKPTVARVDINDSRLNSEQAVLILGAGYDPVHDVPSFPSSPDAAGAGIVMLDLETGVELWRAGIDSGAELTLANMTRAFPTQIKAVDLTGDKLADRMYATDVGGQLWRFDITGGEVPLSLVAGGVIAQFGAEGIASPGPADTRRVFNAPDVSTFTDTNLETRFIGLSVGSGYRAHPLDNTATDRFFSLRDPNVFGALTQTQYDNYSVATDSDLIEVSGQSGVALSSTDRGWKFTLPATQKVLAESFTFDNSVFFVAFSPSTNSISDCQVTVGQNFLYRVSIVNGDPVVNNLDTLADSDADNERVYDLEQGGIAPTPTIIFPSPDDPDCIGAACAPPPIGCVGVECFDPGFVNNPVRTLWTQDGIE